MKIEDMGGTLERVFEAIKSAPEGLTIPEIAKRLRKPINTCDTHVRILIASGSILHTGIARVGGRGRPGRVYASRENAKTSKAWIAANANGPAKAKPEPKPAKAKRKAAPKAKAPKADPKREAKNKADRDRRAKRKPKVAEPAPTPDVETDAA
jgi:hypothetical protein